MGSLDDGSVASMILATLRSSEYLKATFKDQAIAIVPMSNSTQPNNTVDKVAPHALVGVSGLPGIFAEAVIQSQASGRDRLMVLPLSNPTPRTEAIPSDVLA
ncbi:MAG: malic enzyme [Ilumatobacter sp.]